MTSTPRSAHLRSAIARHDERADEAPCLPHMQASTMHGAAIQMLCKAIWKHRLCAIVQPYLSTHLVPQVCVAAVTLMPCLDVGRRLW